MCGVHGVDRSTLGLGLVSGGVNGVMLVSRTSNMTGSRGLTSNMIGSGGLTTNMTGSGGLTSNMIGSGGLTSNMTGRAVLTYRSSAPCIVHGGSTRGARVSLIVRTAANCNGFSLVTKVMRGLSTISRVMVTN